MREVANSNRPERDMSRAHWQRSVGSVLLGGIADKLIDEHIQPVTPESISDCERTITEFREAYDLPLTWGRAFAISSRFLTIPPGSGLVPYNEQLQKQSDRFTFNRHVDRVFSEGMET